MNSQSTLWLMPLILIQGVSLVLYLKVGLRWGWGGLLQSIIILSIALSGLGDLREFPSANLPSYAPWCAVVGWVLMLVRGLIPMAVIKRFSRHMMLLDPEAAMKDAKVLSMFYWGTAGVFWCDLAKASNFYVHAETAEADSLLESWEKQALPRQARESLSACRMSGHIITRDWDGILKQYEQRRETPNGRVPFSIAMAASRAYAEKEDIPQALKCIQEANIPAARLTNQTRATSFLPFFGLSGAESDLDQVLKTLSNGRDSLPEYNTLYWKGRCLAAQRRIEDAKSILTKGLEMVPESLPVWKERYQYQLSRLSQLKAGTAKDWSTEISRARGIERRAELVSDIVTPKRRCRAVFLLIIAMCLAFIVSSGAFIVKTPTSVALTVYCWQWGVLDPQLVLAGQYWRLLTYLFMHAHISHLVLNVVGLWWFGKMSENLYGTARFLAIYFVSGILSGITHSLLSPHMVAVGASGAIMGIFGATLAGIYRCKDILPDPIRKTEVSFMVGIALAQVVLDHIIPHVAAFAHLGGLVSGFLLGMMLPSEGLRRYQKAVGGN